MKAIYINLDPYLAAFAAWFKGGKVGPKPTGPSIPLAVTIPLGETAAIYCPGNSDGEYAGFSVDGQSVCAFAEGSFDPSGEGPFVAQDVSPGLSVYPQFDEAGQKYAVIPVAGDSANISIRISGPDDEGLITIPFTVLVRREQASGPVDLVDFTPPAAALTAAAINTALGGAGALEGKPLNGVSLGSARLNYDEGLTCEYAEGNDIVIKCAGGIADPSKITAGLVNLDGASS